RMDLVPDSQPGVEVVTLPHRLRGPEPVPGQVTPGDPGAGPVDDALDHHPIVLERMPLAPVVRGQQRLDPLPLPISKDLMPRRRRSSHQTTLEEKPPHIWETRPNSHVFDSGSEAQFHSDSDSFGFRPTP